MNKTTRTEEDGFSHVVGVTSGSIVLVVTAVICPWFLLVAGPIVAARLSGAKEAVGKDMDDKEMADSQDIANTWKMKKQPWESQIDIYRTREAGGLIPFTVERHHIYKDDDPD